MAGKITEGRDVQENRTLAPDFCVIGSGAGGGVCALKLAEAGFDVLVLEEGTNVKHGQGHGGAAHERPAFNERELDMYKLLYQEGGGRTTADGGIKVMQGRCLGGGTTVNWSACLPPPRFTLEHWKQIYGLPFTIENLENYLVEIVNFLNIHANDRYNTSAQALIRGCSALGYHWSNLPNNTRRCRECGSCGVGCPYDRKQSGLVTWLPAAVEAGANIYTDTKVERLTRRANRITEVNATFLDARTQRRQTTPTVRPQRGVVLAAGAIGTPAIHLRSKINPNNEVGNRTHIHPVTICIGKYTEKTFPAYGVPDNMMSSEFAAGATGYLIETGSFYPVLSAASTLDYGERLRRVMREYYPFGAIMYAHHCSGFDAQQPYGTVKLDRYGDPELEYRLDPANAAKMRHSLKEMTRIHLAANASAVYHVTNPSLEIKSNAELDSIENISFAAQRATIFTVHVMGGCRMSGDGKRSVVRPDFSLREVENAWVVDASVFPTGLGANPQVTIYALALRAAAEICAHHNAPFTLHQQDRSRYLWRDH